jgi:hypothetical protein
MLVVLRVLIYLLPGAVISGLLLLSGLTLFYLSQRAGRWS